MLRIEFLGCPVDSLSMEEAIERVCQFVRDGQPHVVTAINANKLWHMSTDRRLRNLVANSEMAIPEYAVVWGAARLGTPLRAHIGGVMLLKALLPVMATRGYRPFFLGARPEVTELMVAKLSSDFPGLKVAGFHHGYFGGSEESVLATVRRAQPDVLFVALGTPRQEYWIDENRMTLGVPVLMGVGGSFDVLAGLKADAPSWARSRGLEWLYRLAQEPRAYWKRYLVTNPWLVWQVLKAKMGAREAPKAT